MLKFSTLQAAILAALLSISSTTHAKPISSIDIVNKDATFNEGSLENPDSTEAIFWGNKGCTLTVISDDITVTAKRSAIWANTESLVNILGQDTVVLRSGSKTGTTANVIALKVESGSKLNVTGTDIVVEALSDGSQAVTTAFHFVADEAQPEQSQSEQTQPEETPVPEPNSHPKETPAPDKEPIMHQGATEVTLEQPIAEQRYCVGDVIDILKLNAGDNLLDIDLNHLKQSIEERLPYLENVTVKYRLPNTIVVRADIAQPTYTVQTEAGWVLLSAHQKVLELVDQQPTDKKVLVLGKVSTEVGKQLVFEPDIKPVDEGAILGQTNLTEAERLKQLEQARQDAETEANEQAEKRKNDLNLLLELLDKWGLTEHITTIDVADEMELQVWYQGRILTKLGTDNQLDYKIQFAAEILTKQLSASDKGQLDVSNIREDGELRPVFSRTIS